MHWIKKSPFTCMIVFTSLMIWSTVFIYPYVNAKSDSENKEIESKEIESAIEIDEENADFEYGMEILSEQNEEGETQIAETMEKEDSTIEVVIPEEIADKEEIIGITKFEEYEPIEVNSKYYKDPGKKAFTTEYPYETVDESYFADAAFIGDSRTVGLYDYGGFELADFYCDDGFCTYLWSIGKSVYWQNERKKIVLDDAMDQKQYGKIYILLGMNDCGYGTGDDFRERYGELLNMLKEKQPEAIIYAVANLHVSRDKEAAQPVFNNLHIEDKNVMIAEFADGKNVFYLDYNNIFVDENGFLNSDLTFDGVHLYAKSYMEWADFFKTNAVVKNNK